MPPTADEDFAQALAALKDHYGVSDSDIARRVKVSPSTVHTWSHRKRVPRSDKIRALAEAYPAFSEARLAAAAGRQAPGPLTPDREERILAYFRELTAEQQELAEIQMKAWRDNNNQRR